MLIGGLAIKVPNFTQWHLFLQGVLANRQEKLFSRSWCAEEGKFCPVLFYFPGGFLSIMKRADPLTQDQFDALDFDSWVAGDGYFVPVEHKISSFGVLGDKIVAVDYGT